MTLLRLLATTPPAPPIPDQEERLLILDAQHGDPGAFLALLRQYAPLIRRETRRLGGWLHADEARSLALVAFVTSVRSFDPTRSNRLYDVLRSEIRSSLTLQVPNGMVPSRQWRRYISIMSRAGNDYYLALAEAPHHHMTEETFKAIHAAAGIQYFGIDDELIFDDHSEYRSIEDRALATQALSVLSDFERQVVEHAYGFATGDPMSDAEVVQRISEEALGEEAVAQGQTIVSRAGVHKARHRALEKMRQEIGLEH